MVRPFSSRCATNNYTFHYHSDSLHSRCSPISLYVYRAANGSHTLFLLSDARARAREHKQNVYFFLSFLVSWFSLSLQFRFKDFHKLCVATINLMNGRSKSMQMFISANRKQKHLNMFRNEFETREKKKWKSHKAPKRTYEFGTYTGAHTQTRTRTTNFLQWKSLWIHSFLNIHCSLCAQRQYVTGFRAERSVHSIATHVQHEAHERPMLIFLYFFPFNFSPLFLSLFFLFQNYGSHPKCITKHKRKKRKKQQNKN